MPDGVLPLTGGFPNASTFATDVLGDIAARVLRDEPGLALQYTPVEGIASVREYLSERQEALQGVRPEALMVTSGGMECLALVCSALLDTAAPPGTVTEAFAVLVMGIVVGTAIGNAIGGAIVDASSYRSAALAAAGIAVAGAASVWARRRTLLRPAR